MVDDLRLLKEDMLAFIDPGVAEDDIEHTVSVEHHNFIRWFDILDRLSAQQREPVVRVKELVWEDADEGMCTKWRACALGGHYELVALDGDGGGLAVNFHWGRPLSFWFIQGEPDEWGPTGPKMFPTLDAAKSAAQADYEQRIRAAIEIQSSDVGRDCSEASRRDSSEPEPSTSVSNQYRKSIDRIYRSTDREIWSGEIQSSDGGVEGHAYEPQGHEMLAANEASSASESGGQTHPRGAGIEPGPSEAIADVSVDELEAFIGSLEPDSMAVARALLARYRIERLDRLASSGRR